MSNQLLHSKPIHISDRNYLDSNDGKFKAYGPVIKKDRINTRWPEVEEGVTLAWSDLTIHAKPKVNASRGYKRIVNSVTGALRVGSLAALMGASGAGKSTLMEALAYRQAGDMQIHGDILINGRPVGGYMKYISGYMPQVDLFVGSLTVMEHMTIMANLKLDRNWSKDEKRAKIDRILHQLGLTECLNTRIGAQTKGLSGGEKKRLAFATEILTDPPILFCDEPTTGLDAFSAHKLVTVMSSMSTERKTILCTIHQPSSEVFKMFTQLILLAEGRIAYMGEATKALTFFESMGFICPSSYSPADYFVQILALTPGCESSSKMAVKRICDRFAVSDYAREIDTIVQYEFEVRRARHEEFKLRRGLKPPYLWQKMYWLIYRWSKDAIRNPSVQSLRILQRVVIAMIVGLSYYDLNAYTQNGVQAVQGAIFIFVCENTFNQMYAVLAEFPENTPIFLKEYRSGLYHPATYYICRVIALLPGFIIEPVLFVSVAYWIAGLRATTYAFFMSAMVITLTTNISSACGIMFSSAFESVPNSMAYLVSFDYVLMITSGLFVKRGTVKPVFGWIRYLSWLMYSTEALSIIQWEGVTNITCDNRPDERLPCLVDGSSVLEKYSYSEGNLECDIWNMIFLLIAFHLFGYLCLWWRTKRA